MSALNARLGLLLACLLSCSGTPDAKQQARKPSSDAPTGGISQGQMCAEDTTISISRDSIWRLPWRATIQALRSKCPSSHDTLVLAEENASPGIRFLFRGLRATAVQYRKHLHYAEPPDMWIVVGTSATLPKDLPFEASWTQLHAAYGDAIIGTEDEDGLTVKFCQLPDFFFALDSSLPPQGLIRDLTKVPAAAKVRQLWIMVEPRAGWTC